MPSGPEHPYVMFQVTTSDNWYCSLCSIPDFWLGETGVSHGALIRPHIILKILTHLTLNIQKLNFRVADIKCNLSVEMAQKRKLHTLNLKLDFTEGQNLLFIYLLFLLMPVGGGCISGMTGRRGERSRTA